MSQLVTQCGVCRSEPFGSRSLETLGEARASPPPRAVHTMFSPVGGSSSPALSAPAPQKSRARRPEPVEDDSAVKKFGSAKAISSAQFFGEQVTTRLLFTS